MGQPKVAVLGIWHLGSVYSACLAQAGWAVVGWDGDTKRVQNLQRGRPPLFEPGLAELVAANVAAQRLQYTADLQRTVAQAPWVILAIDTPVDDDDVVDLSGLLDTARAAAPFLADGSVIIVSSQVPIGTCGQIRSLVRAQRPGLRFDVAYVPENLRLGQAIERFCRPDRLVLGADDDATLDKVEQLFAFVDCPKLRLDLRTAEMVKHALNAFLGMAISFGNEIGNLCDELGADAMEVAAALRSDDRIGAGVPLAPGLGFAGGTLARDLNVLQRLGDEVGLDTLLVDAILQVNRQQNRMVVRKLKSIFGRLDDRTIAILGLTYKPGTSTLRRSSALEIIGELAELGADVRAYDPKADPAELAGHEEFQFCTDPYAAADGADALLIITAWPEFKALDFDRVKAVMRRAVLIDAQNLLDSDLMTRKGFAYQGTGRGRKSDVDGRGSL